MEAHKNSDIHDFRGAKRMAVIDSPFMGHQSIAGQLSA